jgi:microsomal dipeptidase-like Zn-dependent dipeptidase
VIRAGDRRVRRAGIATTLAAVAVTTAVASAPAVEVTPQLANDCFAIQAANDGYLEYADGTYRATASRLGEAERFWFKPTTLNFTYLLYDRAARLMAAEDGKLTAQTTPDIRAEWLALPLGPGNSSVLTHNQDHEALGVDEGGRLGFSDAAERGFRFVGAGGCTPYPEAKPGARGKPFSGTNPDGTVFGFADIHLHITANLRAGGQVISGEPFDRFGITEALGHDADVHGADGSDDVTGNLLRDGIPFGTHDTHGWPSFTGWPVRDTNTHQQVYYTWLERAYDAGQRLVVAQTIEDEPICKIEPVTSHSCDETETIKLEIRELERLQDYVDAQNGGPGEGWFRLVYSPSKARRVIADGKLAVVIGVESSDPFGCSEPAACDRGDVDRGLARMKRLGVRSMFVAHWVDNAFTGAALEGGIKGTFINVFNEVETGHYFNTGPCPDPSQGEELDTLGPFEMQILSEFFPATTGLEPMPTYPPGKQCNAKGLTKLGAYLIRRMIEEGMLIEVDHMSEAARERVLAIATAHNYPLVSSHNGTGGSWTPDELTRLYRGGGIAAATPDLAPELAAKLLSYRQYRSRRHYFGVGLGTDTGGFSSLPGPREDAAERPLQYPFRSYDGQVRFSRQHSGERFFDLNTDGVAHYGLFADLIADMQRGPGGPAAMRTLFRSAEAYLQMWELARSKR